MARCVFAAPVFTDTMHAVRNVAYGQSSSFSKTGATMPHDSLEDRILTADRCLAEARSRINKFASLVEKMSPGPWSSAAEDLLGTFEAAFGTMSAYRDMVVAEANREQVAEQESGIPRQVISLSQVSGNQRLRMNRASD